MKTWFWLVTLVGGGFLTAMGEENSVRRLENAQQGMAEPSWPRKPDSRLSPLSGKMKDTEKISPKFFGQDREFRTRQLDEWSRESRLGSAARWEGASPSSWEQTRWHQNRDWAESGEKNATFQPAGGLASAGGVQYREVEKAPAPDWSSRSSRLSGSADGLLRRYDGKLTRVREQVRQEERSARDLGPDRREQFRPEEVEKILAQPTG